MFKNIIYNFKRNYEKINKKKLWFLVQTISFLRILMGIMILIKKSYMIIFFLIGLFADFLDGFLARKFQITSEFGEILDPVADKIFIYLTFLSLFIMNCKTILYIIIMKDIMVLISGIYSRYYFNKAIITKIGKSTMIFMGLYLFTNIVKYHLNHINNQFIFNFANKFKFLINYQQLIENCLLFIITLYIIQYIIIYYKSFIRK